MLLMVQTDGSASNLDMMVVRRPAPPDVKCANSRQYSGDRTCGSQMHQGTAYELAGLKRISSAQSRLVGITVAMIRVIGHCGGMRGSIIVRIPWFGPCWLADLSNFRASMSMSKDAGAPDDIAPIEDVALALGFPHASRSDLRDNRAVSC